MGDDQTLTQWIISIAWLEVFRAATTLLVGIAWPAAILALGLIFRKEIRRKFDDIEKAGPDGVTFRAQQVREFASVKTDLTLLPSQTRTAFEEAIQQSIFQDLTNLKDENRVGVLVSELARARIGRAFEYIYASIFGSQIRALQQVVHSGGLASLADAVKYFRRRQENIS